MLLMYLSHDIPSDSSLSERHLAAAKYTPLQGNSKVNEIKGDMTGMIAGKWNMKKWYLCFMDSNNKRCLI